MGYIEPTEQPILYAAVGTIAATPVSENGVTLIGDATGVANVLTLYSDTDEVAFVGVIPAAVWPSLPGMGEWLEMGDIYQYDKQTVMVRQSHGRTIYVPEDTPALFIVYREDAGAALDWVAGEQVQVGTQRMYGTVLYRCLQMHVTQSDWTPPVVPALWQIVQEEPAMGEWAPWVAYTIGDHVTYLGIEYECRQSHVSQPGWTPPAVLALWLPV